MAAGGSPTAALPVAIPDCFVALNEPRRPWLDPEALKQKFLAASLQAHPDRTHHLPAGERHAAERRFAELNAAYNCLRDSKQRLRHLLELETGAKPAEIQDIPAAMMEFFLEAGRLSREADGFLVEKAKVTSPLLQVAWFERGQEWIDKLQLQRQRIQLQLVQLASELKGMNPAWDSADAHASRANLPLARLEEIYRLLGYLGRWSDQLQERIVRLSL